MKNAKKSRQRFNADAVYNQRADRNKPLFFLFQLQLTYAQLCGIASILVVLYLGT